MNNRKTRVRFERDGDVRFLTFACYHNLPLFRNDRIKCAFVDHLDQVRGRRQFLLLAWVIMDTHVHLLIRPDVRAHSVPVILMDLKGVFSRLVIARWRSRHAGILERLAVGNSVRFWQTGGGYDRNITSPEEYFEKLEYIHANPVRAGLVVSTIDWPWSSARWYAGHQAGAPITIDYFVP